jgi:Fic-DOC domain mobile mystery protein B
VKNIYFRHRDGQTPIPPDYFKDLIPKNIQTHGDLNEHEEQNIAIGLAWLLKQENKGIDHLFWRQLHKKLFADVWKWAGKVRDQELQNPEFLRVHKIETAVKQLEGDLVHWLETRSLPNKEIAARMHERLLTIHPFVNGNGRFSRILTEFICRQHGLPIPRWGECIANEEQRRKQYIAAIQRARKETSFGLLEKFLFS